MNRAWVLLLVSPLTCGAVAAQPPAATSKAAATAPAGPEVYRLTVRPRAPGGEPPLRYRLTPTYESQTPGNAAAVYMATMLVLANEPPEWHERLDRLQAMPLAELPADEARALLKGAAPMLAQLHVAARRETCDWDMPRREHGVMALLPHLHRMRPLERLISLNTRVALLEGRFDDATESLQTGIAFARHCQAGGVLLDGLVAAMVSHVPLNDLAAFIERPDGPNLYWPLANVPRPMIDTGEIVRRERGILYVAFPQLRDPRGSGMTDAQWRDLVIDFLRELEPAPPTPEERQRLEKQVEQSNAALLPKARAHLKAGGASDRDAEAVPVGQAVATYVVAELEHWRDEREKWFGLPFPQAYRGLRETDEALRAEQKRNPNPLLSADPKTSEWALRLAKPDRKLAALRTIEAVRAHAAARGGKPPAKLKDLALAAPDDPTTGAPFEYEARAEGFVLTSRGPARPEDELRYEVTLKAE